MIKTNKTAFVLSAVIVTAGGLMTLDWSQVVSKETAGVVVMLLGGAVAIGKALLGQPASPPSDPKQDGVSA